MAWFYEFWDWFDTVDLHILVVISAGAGVWYVLLAYIYRLGYKCGYVAGEEAEFARTHK